MSNERNSAIQPPYKKIDDHGLDLRAALAGPLLMFLKYGTSQTIDQLVDTRKQLGKHIVLERAASLGIDRMMLDAPLVEAEAPAAPDRSFGCLNEDIYGNCLDDAAPGGDDAIRLISDISADEHSYVMPNDDAKAFNELVEKADDHADPDAINNFWMRLGLKLGFAWTTVRDLGTDAEGRIIFIAQPEGSISAGKDITLDDDPAGAWLHRYCGKFNPASLRFSHKELLIAFNAGMGAAGGAEIEIDGQMMPCDIACEYLIAQRDDLFNAMRDARDILKAGLGDDDEPFSDMTIDGEGVE